MLFQLFSPSARRRGNLGSRIWRPDPARRSPLPECPSDLYPQPPTLKVPANAENATTRPDLPGRGNAGSGRGAPRRDHTMP